MNKKNISCKNSITVRGTIIMKYNFVRNKSSSGRIVVEAEILLSSESQTNGGQKERVI